VNGEVELDGKLNLDEVAEVTGLALPDGPYATVAGYVMAALGQLPSVGDEVTHDGYRLRVSTVDGRRAARVLVTPPPQHDAAPAEEVATQPAARPRAARR
jgi:putative hemolysin